MFLPKTDLFYAGLLMQRFLEMSLEYMPNIFSNLAATDRGRLIGAISRPSFFYCLPSLGKFSVNALAYRSTTSLPK